jgi:hypothetical protein
MQSMRDVLKGSLGRSLSRLQEEDRLASAWPVVCGTAMAARGSVVGYADGVVRIEVEDATWLRQLESMRSQLATELARIAGVRVVEIHFERKRKDGR